MSKNFWGELIVRRSLRYASKDPEKNLKRLTNWAEHIAMMKDHKKQITAFKEIVSDPNMKENNWYRLVMKVLNELHPNVKENFWVNFFAHATFIGIPQQRKITESLGFNIPWAILIDPTERCNLHCQGCWAGDYAPHDLDLETMDRILSEAEELGIYFIVVSGGEPLVRKNDLLELAQHHPKMCFHVFTNGTLIDEDFADQVQQVGNISFAISIEGFRENTDARRGKGVFDTIMEKMDILREKGLLFGFSATYTHNNIEDLTGDAFIDLMIEKGCVFGWFFTYMPVGKDADLSLMATPKERAFMYKSILRFRKSKPIFLADFWNDGEAVKGCIAGGRRYIHINAAGEVEPCAFIHYAIDNIKEKSLLEALNSPLMQAYQKRQPFNQNMLRPCPLLDNPEKLCEIVKESGAHSTQAENTAAPEALAASLHCYVQEWSRVSEDLLQWIEGEKEAAASEPEEQ